MSFMGPPSGPLPAAERPPLRHRGHQPSASLRSPRPAPRPTGPGSPPPSGAILPGSTWHFQTWYRDIAGPCGAFSNLSNALSVTWSGGPSRGLRAEPGHRGPHPLSKGCGPVSFRRLWVKARGGPDTPSPCSRPDRAPDRLVLLLPRQEGAHREQHRRGPTPRQALLEADVNFRLARLHRAREGSGSGDRSRGSRPPTSSSTRSTPSSSSSWGPRTRRWRSPRPGRRSS